MPADSNWKTPAVFPRGEELVGRRVVERESLQVERARPRCASISFTQSSMSGQRLQAEEVHLEEADASRRRPCRTGS